MSCVGTLCCNSCAKEPGDMRSVQVLRTWCGFRTLDCVATFTDKTNPIRWQWGRIYTTLEVSATFTDRSGRGGSVTFDYTYSFNNAAGTMTTNDPNNIFPEDSNHATYPTPSGAVGSGTSLTFSGNDYFYALTYFPAPPSTGPWYLTAWSATLSNELNYDQIPNDAITAVALARVQTDLGLLSWLRPSSGLCNCKGFEDGAFQCFKSYYYNVEWDVLISHAADTELSAPVGCRTSGSWVPIGSYDNSLISQSDVDFGADHFAFPLSHTLTPVSFIYMCPAGGFICEQTQVIAAAGAYHFETSFIMSDGTITGTLTTGSGTASAGDIITVPVPAWTAFSPALYTSGPGGTFPVGVITTFNQP